MSDDEEIVPWLQIGGLYEILRPNGLYMSKTLDRGDESEHEQVFIVPGDIVMVTEFVTRSSIPWKTAGGPSQQVLAEWYRGLITPKMGAGEAILVNFRYDQFSHLAPASPKKQEGSGPYR